MDEIFHSVKASLYDNPLTDDPNDYVARVSTERSLSVKGLCLSASTRKSADISASAMEHGVNLFLDEMTFQLCNGFSVNTGYFTATPLIKGVFTSKDDTFDPKRHTLSFQFNQGEELRKALSSVTVTITGVAEVGMSIATVTDVKTGSVNDLITPNRNLKIEGSKLKIEGDQEVNGVYFVNTTTGDEVRVDNSDLVVNNPSELIIVIPELAAGTYQLKVVTQFTKGLLLKEARTVTFEKVLTVQ